MISRAKITLLLNSIHKSPNNAADIIKKANTLVYSHGCTGLLDISDKLGVVDLVPAIKISSA